MHLDIKMLYGARYCFPKYMRMRPIQNYNVRKCTFQGCCTWGPNDFITHNKKLYS